MEKNVVLAIVLGALVIIAGLQAYQLFSLKNKVGSGNLQTVSGASAPAAAQGSGASLPSNLQNLPSMVGGC
jgi:hypothetical protein